MFKLKSSLIGLGLTGVLVFSLVGCSTNKEVSKSDAKEVKTVTIADGAKSTLDVLVGIKEDIKSKNQDKLAEKSDKLEEAWASIEDQVKEKSRDLYEKVEGPLDMIKAGVKVNPIDEKALNTSIDELNSVMKDVEKLK